jgi:hypothetical protein
VLSAELNKALDVYRMEIESIIETSRADENCKYDLEQVARQVFYALSEFRDVLIKHLK